MGERGKHRRLSPRDVEGDLSGAVADATGEPWWSSRPRSLIVVTYHDEMYDSTSDHTAIQASAGTAIPSV